MSLIEKNVFDFYVNGIQFEYREYKGHHQYEVYAMTLEDNKILHDYCLNNLKQTETAPSYDSNYKISFLDDGNLFEKIRKDLKALVVKNGAIIVNDSECIVRNNYGLYELVYHKKFADTIPRFSELEAIGDYLCQTINKAQLRNYLKSIT
ncbi:MAG: hypothetical protein K6E51_07135 [Treponema sp.]|nr:hypothetical protein [Treponema sp.]